MIWKAEESLEEATKPSPVRDAGLISAGQAVGHYEMARYNSLTARAEHMGHGEAAALSCETLEEEKKADTLLNRIATREIDSTAA